MMNPFFFHPFLTCDFVLVLLSSGDPSSIGKYNIQTDNSKNKELNGNGNKMRANQLVKPKICNGAEERRISWLVTNPSPEAYFFSCSV
ncbi:hypothetical protein BKA57DRAFT_448659 [Linnemannia elongata]|nr:hypothetical protein BKA57DRAFT_448659 [Linnemannia elongata]